MVRRVLLVTLEQALRSLILSLLPITTITLFVWALAGSQSGNTSDPLRASIWFWLAAHLIPFKLNITTSHLGFIFNYLPIGAVLLPIFSIRSSFKRAASQLDNVKAARSFITFWYLLITTIAASLVQSDNVKPIIYFAPIFSGVISLIATINLKSEIFSPAKFLTFGFVVLLGLASLGLVTLLFVHIQVVKSLNTVIEPGWIGGVALVLIQLAYLPNIIAAIFSYICGFGFSIGSGTLVSPLVFKLNGIPAIPVLAALPSRRFPMGLALISLPLILLLLNQIHVTKGQTDLKNGLMRIWESFWVFIPISMILGWASGGTFITDNLSPFGIRWWNLVVPLLVGQIFITLFFYLLPKAISRLLSKNHG